jgi:hypothetical protein
MLGIELVEIINPLTPLIMESKRASKETQFRIEISISRVKLQPKRKVNKKLFLCIRNS